jgi:hypothetical protein
MKKASTKITVPCVRVNGVVTTVRFRHMRKTGAYKARCKGQPILTVRENFDQTGYEAFVRGNRGNAITAKTPDVAFAKCAKENWTFMEA